MPNKRNLDLKIHRQQLILCACVLLNQITLKLSKMCRLNIGSTPKSGISSTPESGVSQFLFPKMLNNQDSLERNNISLVQDFLECSRLFNRCHFPILIQERGIYKLILLSLRFPNMPRPQNMIWVPWKVHVVDAIYQQTNFVVSATPFI